MDHVELDTVRSAVFKCIGLVELERIVRLWMTVHTYHDEACTAVAHASAASTAKQIE